MKKNPRWLVDSLKRRVPNVMSRWWNLKSQIQICPFLPEASFGLRVLSLPASVCVCLSVCQSLACPRDNSGPVQARIAKFGSKIQKTLVKVPIVLGGNWPWPSRSNLTYKSEFTPFELVRIITHYPFKLGSPNLDKRWKIALCRSLLLWVAIDLDLQGQIWFKLCNFSTKLICAVFVNI